MDDSLEKPAEVPKSATRRKNRRPLIFAVALVLIAGATAFIFALNNKKGSASPTSDTNNTSESKETKEETKPAEKTDQTEENKKATSPEPETAPEETVQNKAPVQQEGDDPNTLNELTGVVNYAAVNDDTLMIRVSIDQYLNSGTCLLELTSANDSFSLSDDIMPSASTSSCSYDIATNLLISGKYDIKITVNSENKTGVIKGEVEI